MTRTILTLAFVSTLFATLLSLFPAAIQIQQTSASGNESVQVADAAVEQQIRTIIPMSIGMVEAAMAVLSEGWSGMSPAEQELFLIIYDPSNSGSVDEDYVAEVLANYQKIRQDLDEKISVAYEPDSTLCIGQRLYYVDPIKLHVCPYFLTETIESRKARTLIHEVAHIAFKALDRPYFGLGSEQYEALKPRGHRATQMRVIGPALREILRDDTLYHPDAYAHFSLGVSGQPGALALYLGEDALGPAASIAENASELAQQQVDEISNIGH